MNKLWAVYNGAQLLARKEKGGMGRLIPACFFTAREANQTQMDFNSLLPGNNAVVVEIYPSFKPPVSVKPGKAKVKRK